MGESNSTGKPQFSRALPIGVEPQPSGDSHFRVWAPAARTVEVILEDDKGLTAARLLEPESEGYFAGTLPAPAGAFYRYRLDQNDPPLPDPASRFQPRGPHGPSQIVDPNAFSWNDKSWKGVSASGQVIYEMHIGTFTREGTWKAAMANLAELRRVGITVIEIMPIAEFAGDFGWGYDGVALFAPYHIYGTPDDFRAFVNQAHALGLGVILDVVYNHLGPDGNYLPRFSPFYFSKRYKTDWGEPFNFDGENSNPVREYFLANARYWIKEFHLDGFRLDATQQIFDSSENHIIAAVIQEARRAASPRSIYVVAENEPQETDLVRSPECGGLGGDALWNDDFHHSAMVALTGHNEAYYHDHSGTPQEFISAMKWGYLFQGQWYRWQKQRRGTPAFDLRPQAFVNYIQNHDQVANSATGRRIHQLASPGTFRAMTALLLLGPGTPMLFQGQEYGAPQPFFYFAAHQGDLANQVAKGRREFLSQFPTMAVRGGQEAVPHPSDPETFARCKLDFGERQTHGETYALHEDLLRLRALNACFSATKPRSIDGAVLGPHAFVLRYFSERMHDERLLLVNLGSDHHVDPAPEPLLGLPMKLRWQVLWSSEDRRYGGCGVPPLEQKGNWTLPGLAAMVLKPEPLPPDESTDRAAGPDLVLSGT